MRDRFVREGYVANTIEHPNALAVLDDDVAEDGAAFIVMELLQGLTVEKLWESHGHKLPPRAVLVLAHGLLEVLAAAHHKAIVHRDIKPANVFVLADGTVKVLDFGIARLRDAASKEATSTGIILGTPAFLPPEQALAKSSEIDHRTDIWAVGATMFTLLSGMLVHEGDNGAQLLIRTATQPARSLASAAPEVPGEIASIVDKALSFEKTSRWATADAMREAIESAHRSLFGEPLSKAPLAALMNTRAVVDTDDIGLLQTAAVAASVRSPPRAPTTYVGQRLAQFLVVERLGEGRTGGVYKAIDEKLHRPVALRVLAERYRLGDRNKAIFFREARGAAAVVHPNVAAIHDILDVDGVAILATEFVDGVTLRDKLENGALAADEALAYALAIAQALEGAHAMGVVHGDLKPENAMVTQDGHIKVLDLGLANVHRELESMTTGDGNAAEAEDGLGDTLPANTRETAAGRVMGTPAYMSPEQAQGGVVDARTDVFAMGVMLSELLTGETPFSLRRNPRAPQQWGASDSADWRRASLPASVRPEIAEIVVRCLALRAVDRFADGAALTEAFRAARAEPAPAPPRERGASRSMRRWMLVVAAMVVGARRSASRRIGSAVTRAPRRPRRRRSKRRSRWPTFRLPRP